MSNELKAEIVAIFGASGSGKSHELKRKLGRKKIRRSFIWSPKEVIDRYDLFYKNSIVVTTASEVLEVLKKAGKRGEFHIVFEPTFNRKKDQALLSFICLMLIATGDMTVIVDELQTVTTPSWSPDGWGKMCSVGRAYGIKIYGLSQRIAKVDKDFVANLSELIVKRSGYPEDQKAMANALGLPVADVANLSGFDFFEKNFATGKITKTS